MAVLSIYAVSKLFKTTWWVGGIETVFQIKWVSDFSAILISMSKVQNYIVEITVLSRTWFKLMKSLKEVLFNIKKRYW